MNSSLKFAPLIGLCASARVPRRPGAAELVGQAFGVERVLLEAPALAAAPAPCDRPAGRAGRPSSRGSCAAGRRRRTGPPAALPWACARPEHLERIDVEEPAVDLVHGEERGRHAGRRGEEAPAAHAEAPARSRPRARRCAPRPASAAASAASASTRRWTPSASEWASRAGLRRPRGAAPRAALSRANCLLRGTWGLRSQERGRTMA